MRKYWIYATVALAVVLSFVLSDSFRQVIVRRRAIAAAQLELQKMDEQTAGARARLSRLQSDPTAYDELVRRELGYLRPGEKELRFLKK